LKNPGKLFEADFESSVPDYAYVYRLKDCPGWISACHCPGGASPRFVPNNGFDYLLYWSGKLWTLELKSTKGVSVRHDVLRPNQKEGLKLANRTHGVHAGLLLNFRKENISDGNQGETWYVGISDWLVHERRSGKKSINVKEVRELGVQLHGHKKVTRWSWDVASFIREFD
jgi:penicillin-binding protein-related factor A (putative recombinase)